MVFPSGHTARKMVDLFLEAKQKTRSSPRHLIHMVSDVNGL